MNKVYILDTAIFYLLSLFLYFIFESSSLSVVPILISIISIGLALYLDKFKYKLLVSLIYIILSYFYSPLLFFMPSLAYTSYSNDIKSINLLLSLPVFILWNYDPELKISIIFISILGLYFKKRTMDYIDAKEKTISLSDDKREMAISSKIQRQMLIEKQDYEINMATLDERNRIAREIHDNVGHQLSSAILQVGAMRVVHKDDKMLETLNNTLNLAMDNIRSSVHNLYDSSMDLELQIRSIVDKFHFCQINLNYIVDSVTDSQIKYAVIAIVKEALSNVIKHSRATRVDLSFIEHPAFYQLIVFNDNPVNETESYEGIGLKNIEHRIEKLNGHFRINKDRGFELFITIPKGKTKEKKDESNYS